jgi:hypothetical protein
MNRYGMYMDFSYRIVAYKIINFFENKNTLNILL